MVDTLNTSTLIGAYTFSIDAAGNATKKELIKVDQPVIAINSKNSLGLVQRSAISWASAKNSIVFSPGLNNIGALSSANEGTIIIGASCIQEFSTDVGSYNTIIGGFNSYIDPGANQCLLIGGYQSTLGTNSFRSSIVNSSMVEIFGSNMSTNASYSVSVGYDVTGFMLQSRGSSVNNSINCLTGPFYRSNISSSDDVRAFEFTNYNYDGYGGPNSFQNLTPLVIDSIVNASSAISFHTPIEKFQSFGSSHILFTPVDSEDYVSGASYDYMIKYYEGYNDRIAIHASQDMQFAGYNSKVFVRDSELLGFNFAKSIDAENSLSVNIKRSSNVSLKNVRGAVSESFGKIYARPTLEQNLKISESNMIRLVDITSFTYDEFTSDISNSSKIYGIALGEIRIEQSLGILAYLGYNTAGPGSYSYNGVTHYIRNTEQLISLGSNVNSNSSYRLSAINSTLRAFGSSHISAINSVEISTGHERDASNSTNGAQFVSAINSGFVKIGAAALLNDTTEIDDATLVNFVSVNNVRDVVVTASHVAATNGRGMILDTVGEVAQGIVDVNGITGVDWAPNGKRSPKVKKSSYLMSCTTRAASELTIASGVFSLDAEPRVLGADERDTQNTTSHGGSIPTQTAHERYHGKRYLSIPNHATWVVSYTFTGNAGDLLWEPLVETGKIVFTRRGNYVYTAWFTSNADSVMMYSPTIIAPYVFEVVTGDDGMLDFTIKYGQTVAYAGAVSIPRYVFNSLHLDIVETIFDFSEYGTNNKIMPV